MNVRKILKCIKQELNLKDNKSKHQLNYLIRIIKKSWKKLIIKK